MEPVKVHSGLLGLFNLWSLKKYCKTMQTILRWLQIHNQEAPETHHQTLESGWLLPQNSQRSSDDVALALMIFKCSSGQRGLARSMPGCQDEKMENM